MNILDETLKTKENISHPNNKIKAALFSFIFRNFPIMLNSFSLLKYEFMDSFQFDKCGKILKQKQRKYFLRNSREHPFVIRSLNDYSIRNI
jgi:hypothetical protein